MYKCKLCQFETDSPSKIANHYQYTHKENKELICNKCGKKFKNEKGLKCHTKKVCEKIKNKNNINHICPVCGFYISNKIQKHINICDGKGPGVIKRLRCTGRGLGWNKGLTKENNESLKKISETLKIRNSNPDNIYRHTEDTKKLLSKIVKERYSNGWESKAGRCEKIEYVSESAGKIKVDGKWELQVAMYLDKIGVNWIRNKKRFKYWNDIKNRESTYCPDFYVKNWETYIEVKGYETELDRIKWRQFKYRLEIWNRKKLEDLGLNIKYVKKK